MGGGGALLLRIVGVVEEVISRDCIASVELAHVRPEQERARDGHAHQFVRVHGDGVGEVASCHFGGVGFRKDGRSAPRGVDV